MEVDLKSIIEKIKEEGVAEAEKKAHDIIAQAESRAHAITQEAEEQKTLIIKKASEEAERLKKSAQEEIKQASRDVLLGLRSNIAALFQNVLKKEINQELSGELLEKAIMLLVENFNKEGKNQLEVLLNEEDKKALEKTSLTKLKDALAKGVTLKVSPNVEKGFLIGEKDKNAYYDFTDEALSEAFEFFLTPKISELLK